MGKKDLSLRLKALMPRKHRGKHRERQFYGIELGNYFLVKILLRSRH
jgi:hypothetical protein